LLIQRIHLQNFLSYGPNSTPIDLRPLNVLIGPNGSGKSNLLEAIHLIRSTPGDLWSAIRSSGPTSDWIWKGPDSPRDATITLQVKLDSDLSLIHYSIAFTQLGGRFEITSELIHPIPATNQHFEYKFQNGKHVIHFYRLGEQILDRKDIDLRQSILSQRRDPSSFPTLASMAGDFSRIRSYRGWPITPGSLLRSAQKTDAPNEYLLEDGSNLALVLNRINQDPVQWRLLREKLQAIYEGVEDLTFEVESNSIRIVIREKWFVTPSTRLSDGTLRYLCLLAVLLDPKPAPLVCIDEPELGLHPDVVHQLAELLQQASTRTQLIITTHSRELLDALSNSPEDILVCERIEGQTQVKRLPKLELIEWVKDYGIGRAWRDGEWGGNRW